MICGSARGLRASDDQQTSRDRGRGAKKYSKGAA
jgi:hypothetical protein